MAEKRRGLGRGLGALIPSHAVPASNDRPVDVFFPQSETNTQDGESSSSSSSISADLENLSAMPRRSATKSSAKRTAAKKTSAKKAAPKKATAKAAAASTAAESTSAGTTKKTPAKKVAAKKVVAKKSTTPKTSPSKSTTTAAKAKAKGPVSSVPESPMPESASVHVSRETVDVRDDVIETQHRTDLVPVPGAHFADLPLNAIRPNPRQPRSEFDEQDMAELVHSVGTIGVLQPIVVRELSEADGDVRFELIMGERRWRACQSAELTSIPAIVRSTDDDDLLRDALLENLHRSELNPLEEAAAYSQLLQDFGCTHDELATRIGRSRPQISNTVRLLNLPPLVQRRVAAGVLSAGHARALLGLQSGAAMERLAQRIVAEGLSVRSTEEIVALGDGDQSPKVRRKSPLEHPYRERLDSVAGTLSETLDTRVGVTMGKNKGKVTIEFASVDDLDRILLALNLPE